MVYTTQPKMLKKSFPHTCYQFLESEFAKTIDFSIEFLKSYNFHQYTNPIEMCFLDNHLGVWFEKGNQCIFQTKGSIFNDTFSLNEICLKNIDVFNFEKKITSIIQNKQKYIPYRIEYLNNNVEINTFLSATSVFYIGDTKVLELNNAEVFSQPCFDKNKNVLYQIVTMTEIQFVDGIYRYEYDQTHMCLTKFKLNDELEPIGVDTIPIDIFNGVHSVHVVPSVDNQLLISDITGISFINCTNGETLYTITLFQDEIKIEDNSVELYQFYKACCTRNYIVAIAQTESYEFLYLLYDFNTKRLVGYEFILDFMFNSIMKYISDYDIVVLFSNENIHFLYDSLDYPCSQLELKRTLLDSTCLSNDVIGIVLEYVFGKM